MTNEHEGDKGSIVSSLDEIQAARAAIKRREAALVEFERLAALDSLGILSASNDALHRDKMASEIIACVKHQSPG